MAQKPGSQWNWNLEMLKKGIFTANTGAYVAKVHKVYEYTSSIKCILQANEEKNYNQVVAAVDEHPICLSKQLCLLMFCFNI